MRAGVGAFEDTLLGADLYAAAAVGTLGVVYFNAENREFIDLWLMALETICYKKSYQVFCAESGRYNKKGNCKTNAESVFAYLIGNPDYCYVRSFHTPLQYERVILDNRGIHHWNLLGFYRLD